MPEKVETCPLCGSGISTRFEQRVFRGHEVVYRICRHCGLVYQSPRMTVKEMDEFYSDEYRLLQENSLTPTARNMAAQRNRATQLFDFARPNVTSLSSHLDIGCSVGILLQQFQSAYHNQAVGVEPGEAHRQYALKAGLTVYPTLQELEKNGHLRFDLVTMSHVLEHLADPVNYLVHLRESILDPQGWLLVEVPNLYAHDSFEVAHLYAFSPHTLLEILNRSGFVIFKFKKHGLPNSAILPLFLTVLCRPSTLSESAQRPIRPEHAVALKRRLGMLQRRLLEKVVPNRAWIPF